MKNNIIGQKIKDIRLDRGETQTEFAENINATLPAVSNWETGKNIPNAERLKVIAEIGNISVEELLGKDTITIPKDDYNDLLEIAEELIEIVEELLGKDTITIPKDEYNNLLEIARKYEKSNKIEYHINEIQKLIK